MSLRARLLAGMAFIAAILAVVGVVVGISIRDQLLDQIDSRLVEALPADRDGDRLPPGFPLDAPQPPGHSDDGYDERRSDIYEGYYPDDGEVVNEHLPNVGRDSEATEDELRPDVGDQLTEIDARDGTVLFTTTAVAGDTEFRVAAVRITSDVVAVRAVSLDDVHSTINRLALAGGGGIIAVLVALGLVAWWVVRLGIRPVKEMTETAGRIADGDLSHRIPEPASPHTESGQLAIALNRMLGHIEGAFSERERSEEKLRQFLADASHELRTPVTTIRGYAELYRHGGLSAQDDLDDAMRRTEQEASRMGRLVEDMLLLARLDQRREVTHQPVDLAAVVRDAGNDAGAVAPDRVVTVEDGSATVEGDEDRLRQVVANVVGNALVHTPDGTAITLRSRTDGDRAIVEISDEGPGMTPEAAARATERFFRADPSRSRHAGGSGLGLSIVDAAVTAHGGSVEIDSEVGRGTTVRLVLPTAPTPAAAPTV